MAAAMATATSTARRRRNDAADTRELLIAEAARMFHARGFGAVTIDEICAGLKPPLTKGAYYYIFDSKEAVLFAIHEKYMVEAKAFLDALQKSPLGAPQQFERLFAHTATLLRTMRPYVVVTILEQRHLTGSYASRARRMRHDYRLRIEAIMRQGQREGSLAGDLDAKIMALNYFAIINWLYLWYRDEGPLATDDIVAMCRTQFLRSVLADPAAAGPPRHARPRRVK